MPKKKRKLTPAEKRARAERRARFTTIFVNGKQKRVPRPHLIDGLSPEEFVARNADSIFLVQNEMWEELNQLEQMEAGESGNREPVSPRSGMLPRRS